VTEVLAVALAMDVVEPSSTGSRGRTRFFEKRRATTIQLRAPLTSCEYSDFAVPRRRPTFRRFTILVVEITRITDPEIHRIDQREVLRLRDQISYSRSPGSLSRCAASIPSRSKETFRHRHWRAEKRFGLLVDSLVWRRRAGDQKLFRTKFVSSDFGQWRFHSRCGTVVLI